MAIVLTPTAAPDGLLDHIHAPYRHGRLGRWNSIFQRYNRWSKKGIWQDLFQHFAQDPDMQSVMIDATIVKAHSSSAVKGGI
jgi:transposase